MLDYNITDYTDFFFTFVHYYLICYTVVERKKQQRTTIFFFKKIFHRFLYIIVKFHMSKITRICNLYFVEYNLSNPIDNISQIIGYFDDNVCILHVT